ncbi:MAG TPA: hypothetical protein VKZ84_02960, partial [Bacteriovoracaceae bacterium]|nr:hypothetical protein [Bacteriovoracaceae bacterium]
NDPDLVESRVEVLNSLKKAISHLQNANDVENLNSEARYLALNLSRIYCASLLLEHAEWEKTSRAKLVANRYVKMGIYKDFKSSSLVREENLSIILQDE